MRVDLPPFEGKTVQTSVARFSGRTQEHVGALEDGEFAIVVARVRVTGIQHKDFKTETGANSPNLYARIHDLKVTRSIMLDDEHGKPLLERFINESNDQFGTEDLLSLIADDEADDDDETED